MKKFKLLAFVALALVAVFALSSCGTVSNFNKVFNEEYDLSIDPYKTATKISDVKDFGVANANEHFVVFTKADDDGNVETSVYSLLTNQVIKTVESDEDVVYTVDFLDYGMPICVITSTTIVDADEDDKDEKKVEEPVVTRMYYDAKGTQILSVKADAEAGEPKPLYGSDYVIINAGVYEIDYKTGSVTFVKNVPAYVSTDGLYGFNGEHFYAVNDTTIIIYDADFAPVSAWTAPSYVEDYAPFILNDGNVLIQYRVELAEDAKFYDILEDGVKYNLVTKVLTLKGKEKTLPLNYVIVELTPNCHYYDETADENEYTDKFENIAVIAKIENHMVDDDDANLDIVFLNNSGVIGQSLKVVEGQYPELPEMIGEDLYLVETVYGDAMINGKGEIKFQITNSEVEIYGEYILATNAIYDLSFTKIYDLGASDAEIMDMFGGHIFVKEGTEDDYKIIVFGKNGSQKTVFTYDEDEDIYFTLVYGIGYAIYEYDDEEVEYDYYAVDGTKLLTTTSEAHRVASGNDTVILSVLDDEEVIYYVIKK